MRLGTRTYAYPSPQLGEMADSTAALAVGDAATLRERLAVDGYVLLRGVIPRAAVNAGCARLTEVMADGGWFQGPAAERVARPGGPVALPDSPVDAAFAATNSTMLRPSEARAAANHPAAEVWRVLEAPELHAVSTQQSPPPPDSQGCTVTSERACDCRPWRSSSMSPRPASTTSGANCYCFSIVFRPLFDCFFE